VNNSAGLHKYVDPKDNEVYLFTHLEPFNCHRWFPCFDQPNIRASLRLTVISPDSKWKLVANGKTQHDVHITDARAKELIRDLGIPEEFCDS
jgi:aminopeptidase N